VRKNISQLQIYFRFFKQTSVNLSLELFYAPARLDSERCNACNKGPISKRGK